MGGCRADYETAKVALVAPGIRINRGTYNPTNGQIVSNASRYGANRVLAHETRHYIDDRNDLITLSDRIKANVSTLGFFGIMGVNLIAGVGHFVPVEAISDIANKVNGVTMPAVLVSAVAHTWYYRLSAHERRARKDGALYADNRIVILTK